MTLYNRWLDMLMKWCAAGQKAHAWHVAQELEQNPLLQGISAELTQRMRQRSQGRMTGG